jgi:hypothetical protein
VSRAKHSPSREVRAPQSISAPYEVSAGQLKRVDPA